MTKTSLLLSASICAAMIGAPAAAQDQQDSDTIIVTAQRDNATQVINGGEAGVFGPMPAEDLAAWLAAHREKHAQALRIGVLFVCSAKGLIFFIFPKNAHLPRK